MKPVVLTADARRDLREGRAWYRRQGVALANRFLDRIDDARDVIGRHPKWHGKVYRDVRACLVKGFPYVLYFRELPTRIEVIAVMYARRNPKDWQSRADET